jgi:hypothetical protein
LDNGISGMAKTKSPETKGLFVFKLVEAAGIEPAFLKKFALNINKL